MDQLKYRCSPPPRPALAPACVPAACLCRLQGIRGVHARVVQGCWASGQGGLYAGGAHDSLKKKNDHSLRLKPCLVNRTERWGVSSAQQRILTGCHLTPGGVNYRSRRVSLEPPRDMTNPSPDEGGLVVALDLHTEGGHTCQSLRDPNTRSCS